MARHHRSTISPQESNPPIDRVALYARVSTLNNQDPEMQLTELREYAARRGWQIAEEYVDQGVSGSKESRPELNRLMSDAWQEAIRCRLGVEDRSLRQVTQTSGERTGHCATTST